ncbi:SGNH/GDSL hydrolase family protein [Streptomyces sp. NRRL F-5630]|uniref:SGNH/GDSL hydrolase family protein n=1 Tax=Streptomyces sp. NRRL F-5630 TaxID=1463864 RepID=UPI003D7126DC
MSSRARVARRIAAGAAYGGSGIGLLGVAGVGLLLAEVQLAKRNVGVGEMVVPPHADGRYGRTLAAEGPGAERPPIRFTMMGDSLAAGQGVRRARQTPAALLASGLAAVAERPVELRNIALPGARSDDLDRQVSLVVSDPEGVPDVCCVMIGANDVTHHMPPMRSVQFLNAAVRRLRTAGAEVVVGTCPDLGTVEPVYQPLRWMARRVSRQLAAAQTIGVVEQGGRTVSLSDLLGPEFEANPREMFGPDKYHPSVEGYATAAMAVLPTLCAALGVWPEDLSADEGVLPVAKAAAEAAASGGTEVAAMPAHGGRRSPLARLRRRHASAAPRGSAPEPAPDVPEGLEISGAAGGAGSLASPPTKLGPSGE